MCNVGSMNAEPRVSIHMDTWHPIPTGWQGFGSDALHPPAMHRARLEGGEEGMRIGGSLPVEIPHPFLVLALSLLAVSNGTRAMLASNPGQQKIMASMILRQ